MSVCRVDTDGDGRLCAPELEAWIRKKTEEHFDEGIDESNHVFKHLDPDGDGTVYTVNKLFALDMFARFVWSWYTNI